MNLTTSRHILVKHKYDKDAQKKNTISAKFLLYISTTNKSRLYKEKYGAEKNGELSL